MNKFSQWYMNYSTEITWFVIGLCTLSGLDALVRENYAGAALNFVIAYVNYFFNKR